MGHSHFSFGGVGGAGDGELVEGADVALHLVHHEHLGGGRGEEGSGVSQGWGEDTPGVFGDVGELRGHQGVLEDVGAPNGTWWVPGEPWGTYGDIRGSWRTLGCQKVPGDLGAPKGM